MESLMLLQQIASMLTIVAGTFFLLTGILKLFGNKLSFWTWAKASYLRHHPVWVYYASGIVEIVAGLGLFIKPLRLGAALILILMILLLTFNPRKHQESLKGIWTALITILLLSFIACMSLN